MGWTHFLRHIFANPGDSRVYERNKWLVEMARGRYEKPVMDSLYARINSQLDTIAVVTTFLSGFAFLVISSTLSFENEQVPTTAIVVLLAVSFVVGVCSTLLAISVKTVLVECGPAQMEKFIREFFWMMPFLASLVILLVVTFIGAGLLIIVNRFTLWIGLLIIGLTLFMFLYLGIQNLAMKDFVLRGLGYGFSGNSYTMPADLNILEADEADRVGKPLIELQSTSKQALMAV